MVSGSQSQSTDAAAPRKWSARGFAAFAAAIACALYLASAFPYPDWLDSPELGSAAASLGLFHPPGSPLAVMIGHLVLRLPFAGDGYALMLLSPLAAACAVYGVCRLASTAWSESPALGAIVAMVFALAPAVVMQAGRLEVYTLALALAVVTLSAAVHLARAAGGPGLSSEESRRWWARAMFATGAGLAVHPLIALAAAASLLPAVTSELRRQGPVRLTSTSLGRGFAGGFWLLVLPLCVRGLRDQRWGDVKTIGGWLEFATGAAFAKSFSSSGGETSSSAGMTLTLLVEGAGVGLTLAGIVGFALLVRRRPRIAAVYGLALVADLALLMTQKNVFLSNPDATGYLLLAVVVLALLAAEGAACIATEVSDRGRRLRLVTAFAVIMGLCLALEVRSFPGLRKSSCERGIQFAREQLRAMPIDAAVRLGDFNLLFMFEYLQLVEGLRPDIRVSFVRDPVPEASELWVDAGPKLLQSVETDPSTRWERLGVLWSRSTAARTGERTGLASTWEPRCSDGGIDKRTADVLLWHGFWSSRVAVARGDATSGAELASMAYCAAPDDEIAAAHAKALGVDASLCAERLKFAADAPAVLASADASRDLAPSSLAALLLLVGLALWAVGGLLPKGSRDFVLLAAGTLLASLGLYVA